jgi:hypothetical protein
MHSLIHAISLDRRSGASERVRAEDASDRERDGTARIDTETAAANDERTGHALSKGLRSVQRVEHALFAVVLVTVGYVYLGALLMDAL